MLRRRVFLISRGTFDVTLVGNLKRPSFSLSVIAHRPIVYRALDASPNTFVFLFIVTMEISEECPPRFAIETLKIDV